jgi:hypothetical protein
MVLIGFEIAGVRRGAMVRTMRRKILPIGLAVSLALNVVALIAVRDANFRAYNESQARYIAECKVNELRVSIDGMREMLSQAGHRSTSMDALINQMRISSEESQRRTFELEQSSLLRQQQETLQQIKSDLDFRRIH